MLSLLLFVLLLLLGVPVAFAILGGAFVQIASSGELALLGDAPAQIFAGVDSYGLLALPVFLVLGELMSVSGAADRLLALMVLWFGRLRGGLAQVTLLANAGLAAVMGSSVAQITLMARLAVPALSRAGYPAERATALVAAGGMLAPVIPPSMMLIVFGVLAQVPVGHLFVAGVVPGLLMLGAMMVLTARSAPPATAPDQLAALVPHGPVRTLAEALPAALIPAAMIGAIATGLATAVEAGIFGILAVLVVGGLVYRSLSPRQLPGVLLAATKSAAMVLMLIAAASLWGWIAAWENLPGRMAETLLALTSDPLVFLLLLNLGLLLAGMVLDPMPALILVVPVFLPVAQQSYGIDPVQFGIVTCVNLTMGLLTPPVGTGLFTAARLGGVAPGRLVRCLAPYLACTLAVLVLLILVPELTTGAVSLIF
ncbi:TRAP transporter large permease [Oceanicola sp. S124]|uniref:TRAP transporter large permease n=1 Tax=Oceanicola sp. S124 TaxID=1042378 RepID=UPI000255901B|nr:TRAP transporter large permease [Oceanicola sp. S124]